MNITKNFNNLKEYLLFFIDSGYFSEAEGNLLTARLEKTEKSLLKLQNLIKVERCPLGGDISNDCKDCTYSGEYHFDKASNACIKRLI